MALYSSILSLVYPLENRQKFPNFWLVWGISEKHAFAIAFSQKPATIAVLSWKFDLTPSQDIRFWSIFSLGSKSWKREKAFIRYNSAWGASDDTIIRRLCGAVLAHSARGASDDTVVRRLCGAVLAHSARGGAAW